MNGGTFGVEIESHQSILELKEAIKVVMMLSGDARDLKLFLALKDGAWFKSGSKEMEALERGKKTPFINSLLFNKDKELRDDDCIEDVFANLPALKYLQVHLLVVLPPRDLWEVIHNIMPPAQDPMVSWLLGLYRQFPDTDS